MKNLIKVIALAFAVSFVTASVAATGVNPVAVNSPVEETRTEVSVEELPQEVLQAWSDSEYKEADVFKLYKVEEEGQETTYEFMLDETEEQVVVISESGEILSRE